MSTSLAKLDASAVDVEVTDDALYVVLADGRELAAPLAWFPACATLRPSSGGTGG